MFVNEPFYLLPGVHFKNTCQTQRQEGVYL